MKSTFLTVSIIYLCAVSLIAIVVTVSDKLKAKSHRWRVPEAMLLLISAVGGSVAMYITMLLIRHKTRHPKFMIGIPLILVCQIIFVLWLLRYSGLL